MIWHPRQRYAWNRPMSRREMLRLAAGTTMAGAWLVSCGNDNATSTTSAKTIRIGTPENPVTQPYYDDNPMIESDLEPEKGPLKIYNWNAYIWKRVLNDFSKQFNVEVELTTFYNLETATRKLATGSLKQDVFFPTAEVIPKFVAGKLFQPLNHDYLPNLKSTIWKRFQDPYYDLGSRYTVPYTIYTTGIGWRSDMIPDDISKLDNPWEALWNPDYKGLVGVYDDYRETIGVGMYKNGIMDVNDAKKDDIAAATKSLSELTDLVDVRYTINGAWQGIPEGKFGIHHSWSGDMVNAQYYFPKGGDPDTLQYIWPPNGRFNGGYVSNDCLCVLKDAENPVLAHMFLNFLLSDKYSTKNFSWLGYQPPLNSLEPSQLVKDGYVPPSLETAVLTEDDFSLGQAPIQLTPEEDRVWLDAWSDIKAS